MVATYFQTSGNCQFFVEHGLQMTNQNSDRTANELSLQDRQVVMTSMKINFLWAEKRQHLVFTCLNCFMLYNPNILIKNVFKTTKIRDRGWVMFLKTTVRKLIQNIVYNQYTKILRFETPTVCMVVHFVWYMYTLTLLHQTQAEDDI